MYGGPDYARQPFNDALSGAVEAGTARGPFDKLRLDGPLAELPRTAAPSPLTLSAAYAALATEGTHAAPYVVARVTRDGETVYTARPSRHQALDQRQLSVAHPSASSAPSAERGQERRNGELRPSALTDAHGCVTGGAGGGTERRTVWWNGYDPQLSLSVALFADRPGSVKGTRRPAHLPTKPAPADFTTNTAETLWAAASGNPKTSSVCR